MADNVKSMIYGIAIGDAYGAPFEYSFQRNAFKPSWTSCAITGGGLIGKTPVGTWTDDTSMTIATIDSIHENSGNVNPADLRAKYTAWLRQGDYTLDGECTDCGMTTMKALTQGYGGRNERDNGNGSLMRISPMAFLNLTDRDIMEISAVTHANEISLNACVQWIRILRNLLNGNGFKTAVIESQAYMTINGMKPVSDRLPGIWNQPADEIKSNGYVVNSLETAVWALGSQESYADVISIITALGGDTDTNASIAGAAAGILYGYDNIPLKWRDEIRGKDILDNAVNQIHELIV